MMASGGKAKPTYLMGSMGPGCPTIPYQLLPVEGGQAQTALRWLCVSLRRHFSTDLLIISSTMSCCSKYGSMSPWKCCKHYCLRHISYEVLFKCHSRPHEASV